MVIVWMFSRRLEFYKQIPLHQESNNENLELVRDIHIIETCVESDWLVV